MGRAQQETRRPGFSTAELDIYQGSVRRKGTRTWTERGITDGYWFIVNTT